MLNVPIYIINLRNRIDRRDRVLQQLHLADCNPLQVRLVEAQRATRNGAIGCAFSHAFALSRFLFESDASFCWIIEDDFHIKDFSRIPELAQMLLRHEMWDVLLLASNVPLPIAKTSWEGVYRVLNAQTASSYVVTRQYAPTLIRHFYETGERMSSSAFKLNKSLQKHFYAIDMAWKELQIKDRFLAFIPQLSQQADSFSDIEQRDVSYGV